MNKLFSRVLFFSIILITLLGNNKVLAQWLTNGNNIYYNNGNVGLGTTNPVAKLEVSAPHDYPGILLTNSSLSNKGWYFYSYTDGTETDIRLYERGLANRVTFKHGGLVGIGTTNPTEKLEISGAGTQRLQITETSSTVQTQLKTSTSGGHVGTFSNHPFYIQTNNVNQIQIEPNGNVGIGTTNITHKLTVNGSLKTNELFADKLNISSFDIGTARNPFSSQTGLNIHDNASNIWTNIQIVEKEWSGSHGILFNAYKSATQVDGNLAVVGNTKYSNDCGNYSNGAGAIMFLASGGTMNFYISPESIGKNQNINWDIPKMTILRNGNVGIGTTNPGSYRLAVKGNIRAEEIIVETGWSDFVFQKDYTLMPLSELETFVKENKHLPEIPTEAEIKQNGVSLGETQSKLLQKIEELTLYVIEQNKLLNEQNKRIEKLEKENEISRSMTYEILNSK